MCNNDTLYFCRQQLGEDAQGKDDIKEETRKSQKEVEQRERVCYLHLNRSLTFNILFLFTYNIIYLS